MTRQSNRLRMQFDQQLKTINREVLNPLFPEMNAEALTPVIHVVARARADYLSAFFQVASGMEAGQVMSVQQQADLAHLRSTYEELVAGIRALETAMDRGYLDVQS